ncbi:MAG: hypothetical protein NDI61_05385 [Bdellovibrionaceae bacterium]|nr:hypothetical protein [Pseudobdellovibrionaceae bacterium]
MKLIKKAFLAVVLLAVVIVALAFGYKGIRYLQAAWAIDKINRCLESGGCIDTKTMTCGPYVNDGTKMCGVR